MQEFEAPESTPRVRANAIVSLFRPVNGMICGPINATELQNLIRRACEASEQKATASVPAIVTPLTEPAAKPPLKSRKK